MNDISIIEGLAKPQYLFQPYRVVSRLCQHFFGKSAEIETVKLPWGPSLRVNPREVIGKAISKSGIHETVVTEVLWRLAEPGEILVDVGANIGYTSSILATRAGKNGKVYNFEPHPTVFNLLKENIALWQEVEGIAPVVPTQLALSNRDGEAVLAMEEDFDVNNGTSKIRENGDGSKGQIKVEMKRFDHFAQDIDQIGVMKIDVEGHELPVLQGLGDYLSKHRIRDIVFEEWDAYPAQTHQLLQDAGYKVFACEEQLMGVILKDPAAKSERRSYDSPCFLATIDEQRARRLLEPKGWRSFGLGRMFA